MAPRTIITSSSLPAGLAEAHVNTATIKEGSTGNPLHPSQFDESTDSCFSLFDVGNSFQKENIDFNLTDYGKTIDQQSSDSARPKKSVRFDDYDDIIEITHVNDFSPQRINRLWFSYQEENEIRSRCANLVARFNAGENLTRNEMAGLEHHTDKNQAKCNVLREAANRAVFSNQHRLHVAARRYARVSAKAAKDAREEARQLAKQVRRRR